MAPRPISCVYCGGAHATAPEVRACWERSQGVQSLSFEPSPSADDDDLPPIDWSTVDGAEVDRHRDVDRHEHDALDDGDTGGADPTAIEVRSERGPLVLGRNVLVRSGQPAPPAWTDAPRVEVALTSGCVTELQALAHRRIGVVLEVGDQVEPEMLATDATTRPAHELGARYTLLREALRHLLVSNTIDLRGDASWPLLQRAAARGARPVGDGRGDIELPDGSRAWLDGGPPRFTAPVDDVPVLHRIAVEHGSLRPPLGNDTTADLAPDQLAAVTHDEGAARIIAPAGSGKTRVLTERARHLLRQWNLPPSSVCLVAFNKRAQQEMVTRTADLRGLQVRTLNAIALAIVNGSAPFATRPARLATIDEPEVRRLIGKLVSFPRKRNADPVAIWIEALSMARLGLRDPADVETVYDGDVDGFTDVFPKYRAALARAGQVDYDEQIHLAIELLLANPAVREAAQRACRILLVDEFQDLTPAHLLLVRLLAGPDAAVFGVGDDDQTIYGYNGADPGWLIDFAELFPGAGEHPLEVNYRCPGGIVRAADTLLRHNRRRVTKTIRAHKADADGFQIAEPEGESLAVTVEAVTTAVASGTAPADIAVLTRVNSLLAPVQVALRAAGVATNGGVGREFLERTAIRAALAWLRLSVAGDTLSSADVGEALRRPSRSLHPRIADWVGEQTSVAGLRRLAGRVNEDKAAKVIDEFAADIEVLQRKASTRTPTAALLAVVFEQIGLAGNIAQLDGMRKGMNRSAQNDDLTALAQLAALQPDPALFEHWLRTALSGDWQQDGVTLATVHRVKGQEWPFVVVHHAEADQFPHRLATDGEEERRLFHVAITRASQRVLVVPSDRPSPFILDCSTEPSARRPEPVVTSSAPKQLAPAVKPGQSLEGDGLARFEALRAWRRHASAGKPAYTVFADATLDAIARANPSSVDELARIKGIGPSKLEQYGDGVLRVLADLADQPA